MLFVVRYLIGCLIGLLIVFAVSPRTSFALDLELSPEAINLGDYPKIKTWLGETEAMLPHVMRARLKRTVTVEFSQSIADSQSEEDFYKPFCPRPLNDDEKKRLDAGEEIKTVTRLGEASHRYLGGLVRRHLNHIKINARFIAEILKGPEGSRQYPCGHRNYYQYAQAVLLHELMHVYDFSSKAGLVLSSSPRFRNLSGWAVRGVMMETYEDSNFQGRKYPEHSRSVDTYYEFKDPAETLAVNFEYFMLDPEYSCRKPVLASYFKKELSYYPFHDCQINRTVGIGVTMMGGKNAKAVDYRVLDPDRLYQVHYLLADSGDQWVSRWGHSMFRLVFCAPGREMGPKCLLDVGHHVVVSFRAHLTDPRISTLDGLTGKYPSRMFLLSFAQVWKEYTRGEFRNLVSTPIVMDDLQQERFLNRVLEAYWAYQGKYYFLQNNCAVESMNMIQGILDIPELYKKNPISPKGVQEALASVGALDQSAFGDRSPEAMQKAKNSGHFYPSAHIGLEKDFEAFRTLAGEKNLPAKSMEKWLKESEPEQRLTFFQKWMREIEDPRERQKFVVRMHWFEGFILEYLSTQFLKEIGERVFLQQEGEGNTQQIPAELRESARSLMDNKVLAGPWFTTVGGYGIPPEREETRLTLEENVALAQNSVKVQTDIQQWAFKTFPDESRKLQKTIETWIVFRDELAKAYAPPAAPAVTPNPEPQQPAPAQVVP